MEAIDEKLNVLLPVVGSQKANMMRQAYIMEDNLRGKKQVEIMIDQLISKHVKKSIEDEIILPPPSQSNCYGDIPVGTIEYLNKPMSSFSMNMSDINRHTGIFGATGSGKTTFAKNLLRSLYNRGVPFLVFDWERSYRDLVKELPNVHVYTVGGKTNPLFLNILDMPPGISKEEYIKSIVQIISEDYIGGIGADTMLIQYLVDTFNKFDNPTFNDLKITIEEQIRKDMGGKGRLSGRSGLWKETVMRQMKFLSIGGAGSIMNQSRFHPIQELFNKHIILEFGELKSSHDRKFFIHTILNWLTIYNHHHGIFSDLLRQVVVFEEFHNIVMKQDQDNMISFLFRECRKYGLGLIAIDQTPSEIPNGIYANMNSKISFALNTNQDINAMAKAMNLNMKEAKYLAMLETGQAIMNVRQRFKKSFLLRVAYNAADENLSNEELKAHIKEFETKRTFIKPVMAESRVIQSNQENDSLSPMEKLYLVDILIHRMSGVHQRTVRLSLHPSQVVKYSSTIEKKGYIKKLNINRKKMFDITDKCYKFADDNHIKIKPLPLKGGLEHAYWGLQISKYLKGHGLNPEFEIRDIDVTDRNNNVAIEIETGKSTLSQNLVKLQQSPYKNLFMLATNANAQLKIQKLAEGFNRVRAMNVRDFLKLSKSEILEN